MSHAVPDSPHGYRPSRLKRALPLPESVLRCASTSLTMVTEFLLSYWTSFIGLIHDGLIVLPYGCV
jgi:hypothetical protein